MAENLIQLQDGIDDIYPVGAYTYGQSNPNILRNPWFKINSEGLTTDVQVGNRNSLIMSGWKKYGYAENGYVKYSPTYHQLRIYNETAIGTANLVGIYQTLPESLEAGVYTLSAYIYGAEVTEGVSVPDIKFRISSISGTDITTVATSPTLIQAESTDKVYVEWTFTITSSQTVNCIMLFTTVRKCNFKVRKIKLEKGNHSTLSQDIYDEAAEFNKAALYHYVISAGENNLTLTSGVGVSSTEVVGSIYIPKMHSRPTLSLTPSDLLVADGGGSTIKNCTDISIFTHDANNIINTLSCKSTGLTAKQVYRIILKADKKITFDCEP